MDCRSFRDNHLAFLDDALDDADLVAMQCHLAECEACAQHDTAVRRSLLVFRNLPPIQPSADFQARLEQRLCAVRRAMHAAQAMSTHRGPGLGTFAATAAGVMVAGYLLTAAFDWNAPPHLPEARAQRTLVIVRFEPLGDKLTRVQLHQTGWGDGGQWDQAFTYFDRAWGNVLNNLKQRFERGPQDWKPWLEQLRQMRQAAAAASGATK